MIEDEKWMRCAITEANIAKDRGEVPVGSIIIHLFRKEIREIYNLEKLWDISFDAI